jgi:hypothetical protein
MLSKSHPVLEWFLSGADNNVVADGTTVPKASHDAHGALLGRAADCGSRSGAPREGAVDRQLPRGAILFQSYREGRYALYVVNGNGERASTRAAAKRASSTDPGLGHNTTDRVEKRVPDLLGFRATRSPAGNPALK